MANVAAAFELWNNPSNQRPPREFPALHKAVFMNAHHAGHFNPTVELVKLMVAAGVEVHYYATSDLAGVIAAAGAIYHNYSSDEWSLKECALAGCARLKCEASQEIKSELLFHQAVVATVEVLPFVIDELKKLQPDVVVSDSGYPWGHVAAQHLGIPSVSSCSSKMMTVDEKEALFSHLRTLDYNIKSQKVLLEDYGIEYDPADSYLNYSGFTISWCNSKFLGIDLRADPRCRFFGASQPLPPPEDVIVSQASGAFPELASLRDKVAAGEHVIYVSMGTVVGTEPWTRPLVGDFYKRVFDAFAGRSRTTVVVSVGKAIKLAELPPPPANYLVSNHVPQPALLRIASLFITHNGMNSTNEAIFAGIPMVCMPCFGDQNFNAERVAELGLGVHIASPFAPGAAVNLDHLSIRAMQDAAEAIFAQYSTFKEKSDAMRAEFLVQNEYLHSSAVADIAAWVQEQKNK